MIYISVAAEVVFKMATNGKAEFFNVLALRGGFLYPPGCIESSLVFFLISLVISIPNNLDVLFTHRFYISTILDVMALWLGLGR